MPPAWAPPIDGAGWLPHNKAEVLQRNADRDMRQGNYCKSGGRASQLVGQLRDALAQLRLSNDGLSTGPAITFATDTCAELLRFLSRRHKTDAESVRRQFYQAAGHTFLAQLLASEEPPIIEGVCRALQALTFQHTDAARSFCDISTVPTRLASVLAKLGQDWAGAQAAAIGLICNLTAQDIDSTAKLAESAIHCLLARILVHPHSSHDAKIGASQALTNILYQPVRSQGQMVRDVGHFPGVTEELLFMLTCGSRIRDPATATATASISSGHLLQGAEDYPEAASALIWSLLRCPDLGTRQALSSGGVVKSCIMLLLNPNPTATATATVANERLTLCLTAVLKLLGVTVPNTTQCGTVLASESWKSKRGGPNRGVLPPLPPTVASKPTGTGTSTETDTSPLFAATRQSTSCGGVSESRTGAKPSYAYMDDVMAAAEARGAKLGDHPLGNKPVSAAVSRRPF